MDAKIQTAISIRQLKPYLEAKIPPKIDNFLWRLCRNCIPTRFRLNKQVLIVLIYVWFVMKSMRIVHTSFSFVGTILIVDQCTFTSSQMLQQTSFLYFRCCYGVFGIKGTIRVMHEWRRIYQCCVRSRYQSVDWVEKRIGSAAISVRPKLAATIRWSKPPVGRYKCIIDAYV
jgi:hypothetical protein